MQFHEHSLVTVIFWGRKIVTEGWPTADDICVSYSCVLGLQIYEFFLNSRLARLTFSNEKRKKKTRNFAFACSCSCFGQYLTSRLEYLETRVKIDECLFAERWFVMGHRDFVDCETLIRAANFHFLKFIVVINNFGVVLT